MIRYVNVYNCKLKWRKAVEDFFSSTSGGVTSFFWAVLTWKALNCGGWRKKELELGLPGLEATRKKISASKSPRRLWERIGAVWEWNLDENLREVNSKNGRTDVGEEFGGSAVWAEWEKVGTPDTVFLCMEECAKVDTGLRIFVIKMGILCDSGANVLSKRDKGKLGRMLQTRIRRKIKPLTGCKFASKVKILWAVFNVNHSVPNVIVMGHRFNFHYPCR